MRFISLFTLLLISSCISNEGRIKSLENFLESFIGKKVRDVLNVFGKPTTYYNTINLPGQIDGTYMIYDYTKKGKNCIIQIKYKKTSLKIIDWDYSGQSCSRYITF